MTAGTESQTGYNPGVRTYWRARTCPTKPWRSGMIAALAAAKALPASHFLSLSILAGVVFGLLAYGRCVSLPFQSSPPDDVGCIRVGFRYAAAPLELPLRYVGANWIRVPGHASYAVDAAWFGLDPRGWHATNLLIHLCNVVLLACAAWIITRSRLAVFAGTALFAIWPSGHKAVEWVAARHDLFMATGFLATLILYGLWRRRGGVGLYAGALAAFITMLVSKETALALALSFLVAEMLIFQPPIRWRGIAPFVLVSVAYAVFSIVHFHLFSADVPPYLQRMTAGASAVPRVLLAIAQIWSPWFLPAFPAILTMTVWIVPRLGLWALLTSCILVGLPAMLDRTGPVGSWYLYAPASLAVLSMSHAAASALEYARRWPARCPCAAGHRAGSSRPAARASGAGGVPVPRSHWHIGRRRGGPEGENRRGGLSPPSG